MAEKKLTAKLGIDSKEFDQGLKKASGKADEFGGKVNKMGGMIAAAIGAGGVAMAFKTLKGIFESTQLTGDVLEQKIAGIQAVAASAAQNIANLDWSVSLRDAKRAAEEYAAVLDDLGDRQRSIQIISAKNSAEAAKLRGILRNSTLSETERLDATEKLKDLSEEEIKLRGDAAQEALNGIINQNVEKYKGLKLTLEDAKAVNDFVQNYAYFTKEQQEALTAAQLQQKYLDTFVSQSQYISKGYGTSVDYAHELAAAQKKLAELTSQVPPELQKYIALWRPINDMSDKHRQNIADIYSQWYNAVAQIQNYLNIADRTADRINAIDDGVKSIANTPLHDVESGISVPGGGTLAGAPSLSTIPGTGLAKSPVSTIATDGKAAIEAINSLGNSFDSLGNSIGGAAGAWVSYVGNILSAVPGVVAALAAMTAASRKHASANALEAGTGAAAAEADIPIIGPILAIAAIAAVMAAILSMPKLANGGLAFGPTTAMVGEYAGASGNPEVIAPLSKLQTIMERSAMSGRLSARLQGQDIVISVEKTKMSHNNNT